MTKSRLKKPAFFLEAGMKIIVIGGVAAGMSAAARLRRLSEDAEIIVIEKGGYVSFANCGLPYYIGGKITDREKLILQTPESFKSRFNVDVRTKTEAVSIDPAKKEVKVKDLLTGREYYEKYDKMILAPGAEPVRPPISGIDSRGLFTLRSMEDTDRIYSFIKEIKPGKAVVIGGGYIGVETAENLKQRGLQVTIVEAMRRIMPLMDEEITAVIQNHLMEKNVELVLADGVNSFTSDGKNTTVKLKSGREINAGLVIISVGVRPDTKLAVSAGIKTGSRGILVNEYMQTSNPDIYACGDAVEVINPLTGINASIALAGPANKQGRIAADNIIEGNKVKYRGTMGTAALKIFDLTVAATGLNEAQLKAMKIDYESVLIHSGNHAGYYPGAAVLTLKLLFAKNDGRIMGVQAIGSDGVDKRVDVASAFLSKQGTVYDLAAFEHCYAPPFSSAKDPLNMAGFIAENVIKGRVKQASARHVIEKAGDYTIIDVREKIETGFDMIPGAINIPLNTLRYHIKELPKDKKILIYCAVGLRGYIAARQLMNRGITEVYNLSGGFTTYNMLKGMDSH